MGMPTILKMTVVSTVLSGLVVAGCNSPGAPTEAAPGKNLDRLVEFLCGSFDSSAQATVDESYRDIRLHMSPIFAERTDGAWLYVEQAAATAPEKPYRQRVYHVHTEPSGYASDVYMLPGDALRFTGAWRNPSLLAGLTVDQLTPREGCTIHLVERPDGVFAGSTQGELCASELRGAKFATSKVEIAEELLASWDQGFDESGKQVWGAEKGPYVFIKRR